MFEENSKAIYLQIVDAISDSIASGEYAEDERLPSVRDYAMRVQVNANTAMRAYDALSQSGLIYNRRGIGYFVSPGARETILRRRSEEFLEHGLDSMFGMLRHLGVTPAQLAERYASYLDSADSAKADIRADIGADK